MLQVVHAGFCLPTFHPEIWDSQNKSNYPKKKIDRIYCQKVDVEGGEKIAAENLQKSDKA